VSEGGREGGSEGGREGGSMRAFIDVCGLVTVTQS
jgi:hypothetical protein